MPAIPPPPPGFTLDVPPPPAGFKLDSESSVPPPPPGFKLDDEPNFADVVGGSSTATPPAPLGEQLKQSFIDAGKNIKKYAWDIPTEVLDRPLKPIRESLQQGGITGEMLPDIAKQNFGRFAGGAAAGLERDVVPGLASGENVAMMGAMAANPVAGAALLSKFGGEGAKQAIAATQAPPNETPEEKGRRFAQGLGGAAMAVAPLAHVGSRFVREAVKQEPLDMSSIRPEDLGAESRVPDTATAEGTPNVANARKAEAAAALEKFKDELPPERPAAPPQPQADNGPFHGSREPVYLTPDGHLVSDKNIYGGGMYTTDNRGVADGYAKGSGNVYRAVEKIQNPPVKMYNLDAPADPSLFHGDDHPLGMEAASLIEQNPGLPLSRVLDELRGMSADLGIPRWGVQEYIDGLQERVRADGYGGFSHEGGRLRGGAKHGVKIYFDPKEQVDLIGADKPAVAAPQPFDADPNSIISFNKWVDENAPPGGYREIQDAAAGHAEKPTDVEIQEVQRRLDKLDRSAAEGQPAEAAPGETGAGAGAVGSLGEAAGATAERAADPAARSRGPVEDGVAEEGGPAYPAAADLASLPGGELRHNQATVNEFRRMGGLDSIEESKFKTTEAAIKAEAEKNIGKIIPDLMRRKAGEPITAVENAAVHAYIQHIVENPEPGSAAVLDHLSKFSYEGRSAVGRALGFGGSAMEEFLTDPGKAVQAAMQATKGKMSPEAKMDVAALAQKAKVRKERIDATLTQRTQAAILRLEAEAKASLDRMRHDIGKITVEDILKCR